MTNPSARTKQRDGRNFLKSKKNKMPIFSNEDVKFFIKRDGFYRWVFEIPLSDVDTTEEATADGCCLLCGKKIKNPKYYVHLLQTGNLVSTEEDLHESQGFFPIGSECKKRLPNNFYFKAD